MYIETLHAVREATKSYFFSGPESCSVHFIFRDCFGYNFKTLQDYATNEEERSYPVLS